MQQTNQNAFNSDRPVPGPLDLNVSTDFAKLLATSGNSLAITVGPDGLLLLGAQASGRIHVDHCFIPNAFAVAIEGKRLAVSHKQGITIYNCVTNLAADHPDKPGVHDSYFTPLVTFHTGDCLVHDIAVAKQGLVVANTRFSTVCLIDGRYNINPIWHPSFISHPMPEDRCHLNGLAISGDQIRYVTAFGPYDNAGGWRGQKDFQGLLIDVQKDANLLSNLIMPHSPRLFGERLFVCESGYGAVHEVDRRTGNIRCVVRLPGLTRGLALMGDLLLVGLSTMRSSTSLPEIPLRKDGTSMVAGVAAVHIETGEIRGMVTIANPLREVLDVKVIPGLRTPGIADVHNAQGNFLIDGPSGSYWASPTGGQSTRS